MSDLITIAIPSRGRAGTVPALSVFPDAVLVVRDDEADRYRDSHPGVPIEIVPASVTNLAEKRQWIWTHFGDVFMVDDDVTQVTDLSAAPGERSKVPVDVARGIVNHAADVSRQLNVHIFGFNPFMRPLGYSGHQPFRLSGMVSAHAMGLLGGSPHLHFNPALSLYDDFWLCLLNAHYHRMLFVDQRYHVAHPGTMTNPGGLSTLRTEPELRRQFRLLQEAFGPVVYEEKPTATRDVWSDGMAHATLPF